MRVITHNELEGDYTSALTQDEVRLLSKDIRFIQMQESRVVNKGHDPLKNPKNWIFFYLSGLLLVFYALVEVFWSFRKRNMKQIRYKNALKNALTAFDRMENDEDPAVILEAIETSLNTYLTDKQVPKDIHKSIPDVVKTIETYKYAPGMLSHNQLEKLKDQTISLIEDIEKHEA